MTIQPSPQSFQGIFAFVQGLTPLAGKPRTPSTAEHGSEKCEVEVVPDGASLRLTMFKNQSLLDGGLNAGLDDEVTRGFICAARAFQRLINWW